MQEDRELMEYEVSPVVHCQVYTAGQKRSKVEIKHVVMFGIPYGIANEEMCPQL